MEGLSQQEKEYFAKVTSRSFEEQAKFFLDAFWGSRKDNAEEVWKFVVATKDYDKQYYNALPESKKGDGYKPGTRLDEFWTHKLLESFGKPMSVVDFRNEFKKIDVDFDKHMSIIELLVYWYSESVKTVATFVPGQGGEVAKAQALLDSVSNAFTAAQTALEKANKTEAEALQKKTESEAAEAELKAALNALKEQEDAYNRKTEDLKAKSEAGGVSGMRAKNELAQHLAEDPLPLRKAKITTEAATKKAEKARKAAEESYAKAEADRKSAEQAVAELQQKLAEAEEYLKQEMAKGAGGETPGTFWWMDRELQERRKYMPKVGTAKLNF
eukprot:TRINITY_DN2386_c0_g1_i1.p1 TRINITY_DN2386_c0_g1~~TRINITY_DN2386_c0_g1_i1.p1  ORF type:complete len:328 (+),score=107.77 TRINITY_DN2386_c0_g1_i1:24-1007(+)